MKCKNCQGFCIKKGCRNRRQKYYCKSCKLHQLKTYCYKSCTKEDELMILKLNNEGVGIRSISRITGVSKSNVVNKIKQLSARVPKPEIEEEQQEYEVDEMHTFVKCKSDSCYVTYAINRRTRQVVDFIVGSRTKENIGKVIKRLLALNPKQIYTDELNVYPGLIDKSIHTASPYKINHIERFNLTLRTHLKKLTRKTICFSKSIEMLESCLRIYLWA